MMPDLNASAVKQFGVISDDGVGKCLIPAVFTEQELHQPDERESL